MFQQIGYQKSGNSWLCFLIVHLYEEKKDAWNKYYRIIPNWNDVVLEGEEYRLDWIRGHRASQLVSFRDITKAGLYIVRHPLDIAISSFRYKNIYDKRLQLETKTDDEIMEIIRAYLDRFIYEDGDIEFNRINGCTWTKHVYSWISDPPFPITIIRYEDLKINPLNILIQAFDKIGLEVSTEQIQKSIETSSMENLRSIDKDNFMGSGLVGSWKDICTERLKIQARDQFGWILEKIGYEI